MPGPRGKDWEMCILKIGPQSEDPGPGEKDFGKGFLAKETVKRSTETNGWLLLGRSYCMICFMSRTCAF